MKWMWIIYYVKEAGGLLRGKPPWPRTEGRFPRRSQCSGRTIRCLLRCRSRGKLGPSAGGPPSVRCWWGNAAGTWVAPRNWSGRGAVGSTWFHTEIAVARNGFLLLRIFLGIARNASTPVMVLSKRPRWWAQHWTQACSNSICVLPLLPSSTSAPTVNCKVTSSDYESRRVYVYIWAMGLGLILGLSAMFFKNYCGPKILADIWAHSSCIPWFSYSFPARVEKYENTLSKNLIYLW